MVAGTGFLLEIPEIGLELHYFIYTYPEVFIYIPMSTIFNQTVGLCGEHYYFPNTLLWCCYEVFEVTFISMRVSDARCINKCTNISSGWSKIITYLKQILSFALPCSQKYDKDNLNLQAWKVFCRNRFCMRFSFGKFLYLFRRVR